MGFHKLRTPTIGLFLQQFKAWGEIPLSQSIKIQNPTKSHFSNVDLVWKNGFRHGGQNKVAIEIAYILHVKKITSNILGMVSKPKNPFNWSLWQVSSLVVLVSFDLIEWKLCFIGMNVVMGRRTTVKTPTT